MQLEDLRIYKLAMEIGETIWSIVSKWDLTAKKTIGDQVARSADSIAANIAEGYGRYYYKENKLFCYYSRGSLLETKVWITKAKSRGLIESEIADQLIEQLETLHLQLNNYINTIGKNQTK
ncbi:MAG: four helix bundle protein [Flavobacteriales bacterium]